MVAARLRGRTRWVGGKKKKKERKEGKKKKRVGAQKELSTTYSRSTHFAWRYGVHLILLISKFS